MKIRGHLNIAPVRRHGVGRQMAALACMVPLFAAPLFPAHGQIVFSLDNRPRAPISVDPPGFGNGTEDPFGRLLLPELVGPSPSLQVGPFSDADLLVAGNVTPELHVNAPLLTNYIDAFSSNLPLSGTGALRLAFTVDRATIGALGTAVDQQAFLNQQSADIFATEMVFPHPHGIVLPPGGPGFVGSVASTVPGNNFLLVNQDQLKLTVTGVPDVLTPADVFAPPIMPGTHDAIDGLDMRPLDVTGDRYPDSHLYYSVNPDQPLLEPEFYASAADIYLFGIETEPVPFAIAQQLGLDLRGPNTDDVDALILFDLGVIGQVDPGLDIGLFSLGPGSQSINDIATAADILITDFTGRFAVYASACNLGLDSSLCEGDFHPGSTNHGIVAAVPPYVENVSSLAFCGEFGDMNLDGQVDSDDIADFVQGLVDPEGYTDSHFQILPMCAGDLDLDWDQDYDDIPPFVEAIGPQGAALLMIPEPHCLLAFVMTMMYICRRGTDAARQRRYRHG